MDKKEKIIKGLECCTYDHCDPKDCPYYPEMQRCEDILKYNALELIKSQEREIDFLKQMQLSMIQNTKMDEQTLGMMVSQNMRRF